MSNKEISLNSIKGKRISNKKIAESNKRIKEALIKIKQVKVMDNKKMTPVEWLLDQMFNKKELKIISTHTFHISNELANKAKEMENSIIKSWKNEEKIWIKQLEEKDKEIERLKNDLEHYIDLATDYADIVSKLNTQHP